MLIQIVEDDRALSDGIRLALREPELTFIQNTNIRQAKQTFEQEKPELMILDVNLPDGSGYEYLEWVRARSGIPVLMLTANDMEIDEVTGLSLGADDYMTKPFSIAVLRARIQALRRRLGEKNKNAYAGDGFSFDFEKLKFFANGQEIFLSVNEQRLLRLLVDNPGRILTREVLVDRIWGDGEYVDENALSVTVRRLRAKLEDEETHGSCIQTVYGQGYMWKNG
ncbi:MAG: response regulator transcription factor [Ruminococcus sp.]|jgi:DNA-binding response OmpR family regulator|nr:response regulator transcription factor [Ruminococcus sp.]